MWWCQKRQALGPSKPLLSTSGSILCWEGPLVFTALGLGLCMPVVWSTLGRAALEKKAVWALGKGLGAIWAMNSEILGTWMMVWEGQVPVLRVCCTGLTEALSCSKGHTAISTEWDLLTWQYCLRSLQILASLIRTIEIMRNHRAQCQRSGFASQAGLLKPIPFTSLDSLPSKYSTAFLQSQAFHSRRT